MVKTRLIPLFILALSLSACMAPPFDHASQNQNGEVSIHKPHPLVPQDNMIYQVRNLRQAGEPVYLFSSPTALGRCFDAIQKRQNVRPACEPHIVSKIDDGTVVRATKCHTSPVAACIVQTMNPHDEVSATGAILWDWLQPYQNKKQAH